MRPNFGRRLIVFPVIFMSILMSLSGCSRVAYDALQQREQELCYETVSGAELDRCLEKTATSYEDYEKQRKEL